MPTQMASRVAHMEIASRAATELEAAGIQIQEPGRLRAARVGIMTILDAELEALKAAFNPELFELDPAYFVDDQDQPQVVIRQSSGRGHIATLGSTRDMIELFRPELIVVV